MPTPYKLGRLRGGYCVQWRDPDGKRRRHQLYSSSLEAATAEAAEVYREVTGHHRFAPGTVADLWDRYQAYLGDRPTGKTMQYTGKAVLPHFGALHPDQITRELCEDYTRRRRDQGRTDGTIWTELGHLRSTLIHAVEERRIDRAPKIWRPVKPTSQKRILSAGEAAALIDGAKEPHIRLAITLLLGTAGRNGAILGLKWDRVDFDAGTIDLKLDDSTTRKGRATVPMNPATRAALLEAKQAALSDYVVEWAADRVKSIRNGFTSAVERSGIGHVTIHELRHTAAVTMIGAGVSIEKVAQVLGHSNTAITYSTYARFIPSQMQDAVNVLDFTPRTRLGAV